MNIFHTEPGTRGQQCSRLLKKNIVDFLYKSSRKVGKNTGTGAVSYGLHFFGESLVLSIFDKIGEIMVLIL